MTESDLSGRDPDFLALLESAARLQRLVPDAVVINGTQAAQEHSDLSERFEMVLDALESDDGWATNRITPGKVILGNLDGIEAGVRQMIRRTPLEVATLRLPSGAVLRVPTADEALRIKAFLVVRRNQACDYLDVAALADKAGIDPHAAEVLSGIDRFYGDQQGSEDGVASQLARQLADPRPADKTVTRQLGRYKQLRQRWTDWAEVVKVCRQLAARMVEVGP